MLKGVGFEFSWSNDVKMSLSVSASMRCLRTFDVSPTCSTRLPFMQLLTLGLIGCIINLSLSSTHYQNFRLCLVVTVIMTIQTINLYRLDVRKHQVKEKGRIFLQIPHAAREIKFQIFHWLSFIAVNKLCVYYSAFLR